MNSNDLSGPAFPDPALADENYNPSEYRGGMSLRDYFAGQAILATDFTQVPDWVVMDDVAEKAYNLADAMLRAREE